MSLDAIKANIENAGISEISIGYSTLFLFKRSEFEDGQIGFAVDPSGKSITGNADGDWKPSWYVIGYDGSVGDPLFVDIAESDYPVYTAMIGMGQWERKQIAKNLQQFIESLELLSAIAVGRETPVLLEQNPISEVDKSRILNKIRDNNPDADIEFWSLLFEND